MKLFELLNSPDSQIGDLYWAILNGKTITTVPKKTNVLWKDVGQHNITHNFSGLAIIDADRKVVDVDMTKYSGRDNRRQASKIKDFNHDAKQAYPILSSDQFDSVNVLTQFLKSLSRLDSRVLSFKLIGDDRFDDPIIAEFLGKKQEAPTDIYSSKTKSLTFYHGTSKKQADKILKTGFKIGQREEAYSDMLDNYSMNNIYLSFFPSQASNYAVREAINSTSNPVILKVVLNAGQIQKLRPDEDTMHWLHYLPKGYYETLIERNPVLAEIWGHEVGSFQAHIKSLNHKEGKFNLKWLLTQTGLDKDLQAKAKEALKGYSTEQLEALEKKVYSDLIELYIKGSFKKSVKSGNIAYPGNIPASQISVFKTWSIKGTKIKTHGYEKQEYIDALDAQQTTVKKSKD